MEIFRNNGYAKEGIAWDFLVYFICPLCHDNAASLNSLIIGSPQVPYSNTGVCPSHSKEAVGP